MSEFGTDWSCVTDPDPTGRLVTGTLLVAQAVARRITTPRGMVIDAPDYGLDVRDYMNGNLRPSDLPRIRGELTAEILKDDRVLTVTVGAKLVQTSGTNATPTYTLALDIRGQCAAGPFVTVLSVGPDLTVDLLEAA